MTPSPDLERLKMLVRAATCDKSARALLHLTRLRLQAPTLAAQVLALAEENERLKKALVSLLDDKSVTYAVRCQLARATLEGTPK